MSEYNADELVAPKWMDELFFEGVIRDYENNESIELINVDLSPACLKGDHYASIMFRGKVEYKRGPNEPSVIKSLILKTLPEEGEKLELLKESKIFATEINMYTKTLPKIAQILAEHGDPINLAPKLLYSSLEPHKLVILEDLCEQGYEVMRSRHPTDEEMTAIYRKLAKIHAVSYMMGESEEYKEEITSYEHGIFNPEQIIEYEMFKHGISQFIELLKSHDELKEYAPKFQAIEKDILPKCHALYTAYKRGVKNEIFVVNHGDFHSKNVMYKFDTNSKMEDFIMVDFQLSVYGPPIIDLLYAKYFMCDPEKRVNFDIYLMAYYEQFNETLKKIDFKGEYLKYSDLKLYALRYRHFALVLIAMFIPLLFPQNFSSNAENTEDSVNIDLYSEENKKNTFKNPLLVAELKKLLPQLVCDGYLN